MTPLTPWAEVPLALAAIAVMARVARLQPNLRPLVAPFAAAVAVFSGFFLAHLPLLVDSTWPSLLKVGVLAVLLVRGVVIAFQGLFLRRQGVEAPALLGSVISVLLYGICAGGVAHYYFGFDLTPFLAGSAVVGAVVGLALQDTLGNLFAGIALHSESPFRVGDWVRLGERDGRVEQVSWRAMRLRTWEGDLLTVPNNEVGRHAILNYSVPRAPHSRLLRIGVSYTTPPNKVITVLRGLLDQVPGLVKQPAPVLRMVNYADSAIYYEIQYWVPSYDAWRAIEGEILRLVWYHFRRHGIEIPYPIRNVYLHQADQGAEAASLSRLERALRGIDLFRPLSDDELRLAASRFRTLHYSAGEKVIEEGASGDSFFVIDRGEVQVLKRFGDVVRPLATLMEGQFFGEMALLTGEQRTASVVALSDVDLFTLDKVGFEAVLVANPSIAVDISTILSERREALTTAEGDAANAAAGVSRRELRQRILDGIRSYFGL